MPYSYPAVFIHGFYNVSLMQQRKSQMPIRHRPENDHRNWQTNWRKWSAFHC